MTAARFTELLAQAEASRFSGDPRPGWAGLSTLFGSPVAEIGRLQDHEVVVAGVPFDGTASSRPGAAEGPEAIRRASRVFGAYLDSVGEHEMLDTRTGRTFRYSRPRLADVGDLHVYPTDPERHFQAVSAEARQLAATGTGGGLVFLGGDHSISFPLFAGVADAFQARASAGKIGYIQVDHHFDFGDRSAIHGELYHGSNARRISELPLMDPSRIAFVGVGSVTRKDQFDALQAAGYAIVKAADFKEQGTATAVAGLVADFEKRCQGIYLSIDIDVLDAAEAPGTGNVTFGGLRTAELFDLVEAFRRLPLLAVDIVEVAPRYDPSGRTAQIAALLLFELLFRRASS